MTTPLEEFREKLRRKLCLDEVESTGLGDYSGLSTDYDSLSDYASAIEERLYKAEQENKELKQRAEKALKENIDQKDTIKRCRNLINQIEARAEKENKDWKKWAEFVKRYMGKEKFNNMQTSNK